MQSVEVTKETNRFVTLVKTEQKNRKLLKLFEKSEVSRGHKMSQFWHANWGEDAFIPKRLQNWEVPGWHPEWPDRHCRTSPNEADLNGRVTPDFRRTNPWGNFKGTWELPLKIDRKTAEKISRASEYKKKYWKAHYRKNAEICSKVDGNLDKQTVAQQELEEHQERAQRRLDLCN